MSTRLPSLWRPEGRACCGGPAGPGGGAEGSSAAMEDFSTRTYGTSGLDNRPLFGETSARVGPCRKRWAGQRVRWTLCNQLVLFSCRIGSSTWPWVGLRLWWSWWVRPVTPIYIYFFKLWNFYTQNLIFLLNKSMNLLPFLNLKIEKFLNICRESKVCHHTETCCFAGDCNRIVRVLDASAAAQRLLCRLHPVGVWIDRSAGKN